jgi:hypothetical protein
MTSAPPEAPAASATPPISPPADTPAGGEDSGGESFIRIRPLTGGDATRDASPPRPAVPQPNAAAPSAPASGAPGGNGPSLPEARLHQQNGFNYWRQADYAAAYQEYEYAEQLYRLIAARGGPDASAALQGMRAAQQGMQASRGHR